MRTVFYNFIIFFSLSKVLISVLFWILNIYIFDSTSKFYKQNEVKTKINAKMIFLEIHYIIYLKYFKLKNSYIFHHIFEGLLNRISFIIGIVWMVGWNLIFTWTIRLNKELSLFNKIRKFI